MKKVTNTDNRQRKFKIEDLSKCTKKTIRAKYMQVTQGKEHHYFHYMIILIVVSLYPSLDRHIVY